MSFTRTSLFLVLACTLALSATVALAHVSVAGPAFAGSRQVLNFSIGHGCEGADPYRLEVEIPEEVTSLRVAPSAWGEAEVTTNAEGIITKVAWEKATVREADDSFYQFAIRITVPELPFTQLAFPSTEYCRTADGVESMTAWTSSPAEIEAAGENGGLSPYPSLWVMPARAPGWNKYTVEDDLDDLSIFDDAQIVWQGDAAYSATPAIMDLIEAEEDVDTLSSIKGGSDIWVKY